MPPPLRALPRDAALILFDFLAPAVAPFAALDAATWTTFKDDVLVWKKAVQAMAGRSKEARARLRAVAPALLAKWPELNRWLPQVVSDVNARRIDLSPDGRLLALGSEKMIKVLETGSLSTMASFTAPTVYQLRFSPDSSLLACATGDSGIIIYDCKSPHFAELAIRTITGQTLGRMAFFPNGYVVGAGFAGHIAVWSDVLNSNVTCWESESHGLVCAFATTSSLLVSGHVGGQTQLWTASGERSRMFQGHSNAVLGLVFSGDERTLVSVSEDRTSRVWNVSTGECTHFYSPDLGCVYGAALSASGLMALCYFGGTVQVYLHAGSDQVVRRFELDEPLPPWNVTFSCGEILSKQGQVVFVTTWSGKCLKYTI